MSEQGASSTAWSHPSDGEISRYYCHTCEAEFDNVTRRNDEMLCQNCNNGFIELIETPQDLDSNSSEFNNAIDVDDRQFLTSIIQEAFQRGLGLPVQMNEPADPRLRGRRVNATIRNHGPQPLEHILSDLLVGIGTAGFGQEGNSPLVFLGNPGDYAWGREGLDTIVTQLLNQMDGSGPPPLPTEKIKEIPVAHITKAQIDANLQCSVCWEPFTLDEEVRRLPCDHYYHTPCIEPWLALHGTCPICRQALHTGSAAGEGSHPVNDMASALADGLAGSMAAGLSSLTNSGNSSSTGAQGLNLGATLGNLASVLLGGGRTPPSTTSRVSNSNPSSTRSNNDSNSTGDNSSSSNTPRSFFDMDFD